MSVMKWNQSDQVNEVDHISVMRWNQSDQGDMKVMRLIQSV